MADVALVNESSNKFVDISSESFRQYNFGSKGFVRIEGPQWLSAGPNGHRVVDVLGECHYIPNGWLQINWKPRPDQPHFVK